MAARKLIHELVFHEKLPGTLVYLLGQGCDYRDRIYRPKLPGNK